VTILDWGLLLLWLGVALSGFWKGAIRIVFGAGGALVGLWLALITGADLALWMTELISVQWLAAVLGRLLPILACVALFGVAGWGIDRTLQAMHLGWLNRIAGAVLAGAVAAVLLGVLLVTAVEYSPNWQESCERSLIAPRLVNLSQSIFGSRPAVEELVPEVEVTPEMAPEAVSSPTPAAAT